MRSAAKPGAGVLRSVGVMISLAIQRVAIRCAFPARWRSSALGACTIGPRNVMKVLPACVSNGADRGFAYWPPFQASEATSARTRSRSANSHQPVPCPGTCSPSSRCFKLARRCRLAETSRLSGSIQITTPDIDITPDTTTDVTRVKARPHCLASSSRRCRCLQGRVQCRAESDVSASLSPSSSVAREDGSRSSS